MTKEVWLIFDTDDHEPLDIVLKGKMVKYLENADEKWFPHAIIDAINDWKENHGIIATENDAIEILRSAGYDLDEWGIYE